MIPNLQRILKEWSYKVGAIKPNNKSHIEQLRQILKRESWEYDVINEFIENLTNGKKIINEAATNRTEDLHEIFFAIAFAGGDISKAKNLNDLKKIMNKLKLKLDNKNKNLETLSKFDKMEAFPVWSLDKDAWRSFRLDTVQSWEVING